MFSQLFFFSYIDFGKSKGGSSSNYAFWNGKNEGNPDRDFETATGQFTHSLGIACYDLRYRLYLGRDTRNFQPRNSLILAEYVEFY